MGNTVISVNNISKQYRLGQVGTGALSHDINRFWHRLRGKEDPYLKVGESNERSLKGLSEYVWALKDVNFEVQQGEMLGIIGRNGAGKSTLLKILSRTTAPTTGSIKVKGRIASLLEVGTGFHPELTGRDNIFLNGAILGMTKQEIKSKFDEIVEFAGVERYVDTPVKRYSSGMYVRLAFAVAAHLEPEILIVDEVLAVGDAEFQKKAIGKMKAVSDKDGRTVLFVSHNMGAIKQLCSKAIMMRNGFAEPADNPIKVINDYLQVGKAKRSEYEHKAGRQEISILKVEFLNPTQNTINVFEEIRLKIYVSDNKIGLAVSFFVLIYDMEGNCITSIFEADDTKFKKAPLTANQKIISFKCNLPPGPYSISVGIFNDKMEFVDWVENCETFDVTNQIEGRGVFLPRLGASVQEANWHNG